MTREFLLNGLDQHSWPPCTNWFQLAAFNIDSILLLFNKTGHLNEEVYCTELSTSVRFPLYNFQLPYFFIEDPFIGGWMADRCNVPRVDIKAGFNMLLHLVRPAREVNATYDKVFHYVNGYYKRRVHHFLLKSIIKKQLFEYEKINATFYRKPLFNLLKFFQ
jgi:hypothetical protein